MIEKIISVLASPLSYIIIISVVITVHELGHYLVGRFFGAAVESFSLGFGKSVVEATDSRGTRWRLNWLPFGGFVKFVGELQTPNDEAGSDSGNKTKALKGLPYGQLNPWQRLAVSLGGPAANLVFAIVIFAGFAMMLGVPQSSAVRVTGIAPDMPAAEAGFEVGDVLLRAGDRPVMTTNDIQRATMLSAGEPVQFLISRDGRELELRATPQETVERNEAMKITAKVGRIGLQVASADLEVRRYDPVSALGYGVQSVGNTVMDTFNVLRRLVTKFQDMDKLSGPFGIFYITDNVTDYQMQQTQIDLGERIMRVTINLIEISALLSIGVAIFNLLPIPVLDGGAAILCVAEGITGKSVPEAVHRVGLTIGLACLVSFALVVTWYDVARWLEG